MTELQQMEKVYYPRDDRRNSDPVDETSDRFKLEFSEENINGFKALKKGLTNAAKTAGSKQWVDNADLSIYNALDCMEPKYNLDYLAALYDTSHIHGAAVDAKIDNIVGLGYYFDTTHKAGKLKDKAAAKDEDARNRLEARLADAKQKLIEITDEWNSTDEFDETLEKFLSDRFTMGNGYLEIGRTVEGKIGYVGHIPAQEMRVRRKRDGFVQLKNNEPIFFRNFGDRKTKDPFGKDSNPNEIIHYKSYSPVDMYYGVPEIISAVNQIAGIEFATKYNIDYFENKAVPRYIIITKGVTVGETNQKELLKFFETATKGTHHRSIVVPLPTKDAEIEFKPVETGKQESSFDEYIKLNQNIILQRHRVPGNRLGKSDGTSLAASRDADKIFKESVCRPEQRKIEKKINKIYKEQTDLFEFKLNEYALTDEDQQSQIDERYLRWGVLTPDEVRAKRGLGPRPDGKGDEPVDAKTQLEMQQQAAEKMQKDQLASQEKTAKANAAAAKATAPAAGAKPATGRTAASKQRAEQKAQTNQSRTRDQNRSASKPDSAGAATGRNTKGSGRKVG